MPAVSPKVEEINKRIDKEIEKIFFPPCEPWCLGSAEETEDWLEFHLELEEESLEKIAKERIDGLALSLMAKEDFGELGLSERDMSRISEVLFSPGLVLIPFWFSKKEVLTERNRGFSFLLRKGF